MIQLCNKYTCTQCRACITACPKGCITMEMNEEGFSIPKIDSDNCLECGTCLQVCHMKNPPKLNNTPIHTLACWTKNDRDRRKSSSGGAFSVLAKKILSIGGVVYGATMDKNFKVKHICIDNLDDLYLLQGSKYVQSYLGDTYKQVRELLKKGQTVLFTGTPCQVGGLLSFLRRKYTNLITIDIVCHGVPSQKTFDTFCEKANISRDCDTISFRFTEGWGFRLSRDYITKNDSSVQITHKPVSHRKAWYMRAFNKSLMFNETCYQCRYSSPNRVSDFTMADYWGLGITSPFNHATYKGISMLLVNNDNSWTLLKECSDLFYEERTLEEAIKGNHNLSNQSTRPNGRDTFIKDMISLNQHDLMTKYNIKENYRDYLRLLKQWINQIR